MKSLTLVVMAAGMGSRFGGLKQIEPVGPSGEIIADYSVYDAIKAGYDKVVFIIRKENLDYFKQNITSRFEDKIKVEYAFQELDMIPNDVTLPKERVKMLGTGHAVLCAKDNIEDNFVVINGDDFYGLDAFLKAKEFFESNPEDDEYVTVNYPILSVLSENGGVKRGICYTKDGYIEKTIETVSELIDDKIIAKPLAGGDEFEVSKDATSSMNFMGFQHKFLDVLGKDFETFIHGNITESNEFLLPDILDRLIKKGLMKGKVKVASSKWMGITYKEDLPQFKQDILKLVNDGKYPENLWK